MLEDADADDHGRHVSTVEDDYLNLDDMEAFLQEAEETHARDSESSDEEALDNVLDDMMGRKKPKAEEQIDLSADPLANAKHDDFFDPVSKTKKKVRFQDDKVSDDSESEPSLGLDESGSEEDEESGDDEFEDDQFGMDQDSGQDDSDVGDDDEEEEEEGLPSKHQMKLDRISSKIRKMEEEALEEKEWYMRGEISGFHRPKNSALEVDLDFETTMKPPPQPTEETTQSLEEMIKQRIADHRFDDVIAIVPSNDEKKKITVELDDVKSSQGLGEIYENEYLAARMQGTAEDKEEPIRELAKKQFIALCAKLDQLSHGQYKPMPSIEEVTFKVDVPAIMMEEATPAFVSDASMRKPEEVYKPGQSLQKSITVEDEEGDEKVITTRDGMMQADGVAKSEAELTREDRKRRRAARKRAYKKHKMSKDANQIQRALAAGKTPVPGRKSEAANQMLQKLAQSAKKSSDKNFNKSREVFARMNDIAAGVKPAEKPANTGKKAMHLKL
jgi:U3 small nucleolar RNA-associated protein MPP10